MLKKPFLHDFLARLYAVIAYIIGWSWETGGKCSSTSSFIISTELKTFSNKVKKKLEKTLSNPTDGDHLHIHHLYHLIKSFVRLIFVYVLHYIFSGKKTNRKLSIKILFLFHYFLQRIFHEVSFVFVFHFKTLQNSNN